MGFKVFWTLVQALQSLRCSAGCSCLVIASDTSHRARLSNQDQDLIDRMKGLP